MKCRVDLRYIQDVGILEVDTKATHGGWDGEQFQIGNLWAESNSCPL